MAGANRPGYKPSAKASRDATARKSIFYDLKPDTITRVRLTPPSDPSGSAFFVKTDHYKMKNAEGNGTALACLDQHGEGDCPICRIHEKLEATGDKADAKIAKDIEAGSRWYIQAYVKGIEEEGPKLIGLSRTTADKISEILSMQEDGDEPLLLDPDKGTWVVIKRKGSGFATRYEVQLSATATPLDKLRPGWEKEFIEDVPAAARLKMESAEEMIESFRRAFGDQVNVNELLA